MNYRKWVTEGKLIPFHLHLHDLNVAYTFNEELTLMENVYKLWEILIKSGKEIEESMNMLIDLVNEFISEDLSLILREVLNEWKEDGTLKKIIDEEIFKEMNDRLDNLESLFDGVDEKLKEEMDKIKKLIDDFEKSLEGRLSGDKDVLNGYFNYNLSELKKQKYPYPTGDYDKLIADIDKFVGEGKLKKTVLGKDSSGKYDIPYYETTPKNYKHKMFILGGKHGDEYFAIDLIEGFINQLYGENSDKRMTWLKNNVKFYILPVANPWGYVNNKRNNVNNINLDRNYKVNGWGEEPDKDKGTRPMSEIEVKHSITFLTDNILPHDSLLGYLEVHTWNSYGTGGKWGTDLQYYPPKYGETQLNVMTNEFTKYADLMGYKYEIRPSNRPQQKVYVAETMKINSHMFEFIGYDPGQEMPGNIVQKYTNVFFNYILFMVRNKENNRDRELSVASYFSFKHGKSNEKQFVGRNTGSDPALPMGYPILVRQSKMAIKVDGFGYVKMTGHVGIKTESDNDVGKEVEIGGWIYQFSQDQYGDGNYNKRELSTTRVTLRKGINIVPINYMIPVSPNDVLTNSKNTVYGYITSNYEDGNQNSAYYDTMHVTMEYIQTDHSQRGMQYVTSSLNMKDDKKFVVEYPLAHQGLSVDDFKDIN